MWEVGGGCHMDRTALDLAPLPSVEPPTPPTEPHFCPHRQLEARVAEIHQPRPAARGVWGDHDRPRWQPQVPDQGPVPRGRGGRGDGRGAVPAHHPRLQINYGGDVPQHYFLRNHVRVQYDHQATVGRGSSLQVDNEILFPGCVLRWARRPPHTPGVVGRGPEPRQVAVSGALSPAGGSLRRTEGT